LLQCLAKSENKRKHVRNIPHFSIDIILAYLL